MLEDLMKEMLENNEEGQVLGGLQAMMAGFMASQHPETMMSIPMQIVGVEEICTTENFSITDLFIMVTVKVLTDGTEYKVLLSYNFVPHHSIKVGEYYIGGLIPIEGEMTSDNRGTGEQSNRTIRAWDLGLGDVTPVSETEAMDALTKFRDSWEESKEAREKMAAGFEEWKKNQEE